MIADLPAGWTEFSEDVLRVAALSEGLASHARSLLGELSVQMSDRLRARQTSIRA